MPLHDLLVALPAVAFIVVVPGFALATIAGPSLWWAERLAMATSVGVGLIGTIGLIERHVGVGFRSATVLPFLALVVIAAPLCQLTIRRHRGQSTGAPEVLPHWGVVAGALAMGAISCALVAASSAGWAVPPENDGPTHGQVAMAIKTQQNVIPHIPWPITGGGFTRPRAAFEAASVVIGTGAGLAPLQVMTPLALAAVLLLPLSLAVLAWRATGSSIAASVAPMLAVSMTIPGYPLTYGEWPYLVDLTLVVPLVLAVDRAMRHRRTGSLAVIAMLIGAALVTHGLEPITAGVIGAPLVLSGLATLDWRTAVKRAGTVAAVVAISAIVALTLTHAGTPAAGTTPIGTPSADQARPYLGLGSHGVLTGIGDLVVTEMTPVLFLLFATGVVACLRTRRLRWTLVAASLLLVLYLDADFIVFPAPVMTALFPWTVPDRLVSIEWFVVPLTAAWGVVWIGSLSVPRLLRKATSDRRVALRAAALPLGLLIIIAVATGATGQRNWYESTLSSLTAPADLAGLSEMDARLKPGSIVLTDGPLDSGVWIDSLTRDHAYASLAFYRNHEPATGLYLQDARAIALSDACKNPQAAASALEGMDAAWIGSKALQWPGTRPWTVKCLRRIPGWSVASATAGADRAPALLVRAVTPPPQ